jgi:hypothetical protein
MLREFAVTAEFFQPVLAPFWRRQYRSRPVSLAAGSAAGGMFPIPAKIDAWRRHQMVRMGLAGALGGIADAYDTRSFFSASGGLQGFSPDLPGGVV